MVSIVALLYPLLIINLFHPQHTVIGHWISSVKFLLSRLPIFKLDSLLS